MKNFTSQSKQIALLAIYAFIAVAALPSPALAEAPIDRVVEAFQSVLRDNNASEHIFTLPESTSSGF